MAVTVKELIAMLQQVEDKDLDVVVCTEDGHHSADLDVVESALVYYGKSDAKLGGWTACTRRCVVIDG